MDIEHSRRAAQPHGKIPLCRPFITLTMPSVHGSANFLAYVSHACLQREWVGQTGASLRAKLEIERQRTTHALFVEAYLCDGQPHVHGRSTASAPHIYAAGARLRDGIRPERASRMAELWTVM